MENELRINICGEEKKNMSLAKKIKPVEPIILLDEQSFREYR
jgi:hypothetical protein